MYFLLVFEKGFKMKSQNGKISLFVFFNIKENNLK